MRARTIIELAVAITACLLAGGVGSFLSGPDVRQWYQTVRRPDWSPPGWVFGPVWTTLYVLMGISAWLLWQRRHATLPRTRRLARAALIVFVVQLVLNAAWPGIFFGLGQFGWAFAELIALWAMIAATILLAWAVSRPAALLLLPYLAWVTFAGALNYAIWQMNR